MTIHSVGNGKFIFKGIPSQDGNYIVPATEGDWHFARSAGTVWNAIDERSDTVFASIAVFESFDAALNAAYGTKKQSADDAAWVAEQRSVDVFYDR